MRYNTLFLLSVSTLTTGCFASRLTQTAEPLGEGISEVSISFNSTQITTINGEDVGGFWPNLIPNAHYGIGISDKMDFFGNLSLASWYGEVGVKYALSSNSDGALSLAPSVGLSPLGPLASTRTTLPLLYTRRLSETSSVTVMAEATYRRRGDASSSSFGEDLSGTFVGNTLGVGGGIGFEVRGRSFYVRPALTYTYYNATLAGAEDDQAMGMGQVAVTIGRTGGKMEAQLDRIEQKLDNMDP